MFLGLFPVRDRFYIWTFLLEQTSISLHLILSCAPAAHFYIWRMFNSTLPELFCCRTSPYTPPLSVLYILYLNATRPRGGPALNYGALATFTMSFP